MMLDVFVRASIGGAIVVAVVWIVNRVAPGLPPSVRALLWWCAAAKFVVALAWTAPVLVPVLPAPEVGSIHAAVVTTSQHGVSWAVSDIPTSNAAAIGWSSILFCVWTLGFCIAMQRGFVRWRTIRRAVRNSSPAPRSIQDIAIEVARDVGVRRMPAIRCSSGVGTPLVTGLLRPVVLLPADRLRAMTQMQQRMTLCHELLHLKRWDLWFGCLPALAERLFFFHPAAHAAAREYVFWREAACDAAVIKALDAAPQEYGRLLFELGVARRGTTLAAAGAPWSFSVLKRRIVMLRGPASPSIASRVAASMVVVLALMAIVPFHPSARTLPAAPPFDGVVTSPAPATDDGQTARNERRDEKLNFVLFRDDDRTTMSGSVPRDLDRARRFKRPGEQLLWFRLNDREYIVRDPGVLREVDQAWEPVGRIGEEQGIIGGKQGEIGAKQGDIGARQGVIGAEQGRIGSQQGQIGTRQGQLAAREAAGMTQAQRADLEKERRELDKRMRELDQEMEKLGEKMREFEKPMDDLNMQMKVLDAQMSMLGAKMEEATKKAEEDMRRLLERAISKGLAESVK